jgi:hypothetical protein
VFAGLIAKEARVFTVSRLTDAGRWSIRRKLVAAKHRIPFNLASRQGKESQYLEEAFDEWHTAADGSFTRRCERLLKETVGSAGVLLTTSCTHALEMCALAARPRAWR